MPRYFVTRIEAGRALDSGSHLPEGAWSSCHGCASFAVVCDFYCHKWGAENYAAHSNVRQGISLVCSFTGEGASLSSQQQQQTRHKAIAPLGDSGSAKKAKLLPQMREFLFHLKISRDLSGYDDDSNKTVKNQ